MADLVGSDKNEQTTVPSSSIDDPSSLESVLQSLDGDVSSTCPDSTGISAFEWTFGAITSSSTAEHINENVEDIVQDLENLLSEPTTYQCRAKDQEVKRQGDGLLADPIAQTTTIGPCNKQQQSYEAFNVEAVNEVISNATSISGDCTENKSDFITEGLPLNADNITNTDLGVPKEETGAPTINELTVQLLQATENTDVNNLCAVKLATESTSLQIIDDDLGYEQVISSTSNNSSANTHECMHVLPAAEVSAAFSENVDTEPINGQLENMQENNESTQSIAVDLVSLELNAIAFQNSVVMKEEFNADHIGGRIEEPSATLLNTKIEHFVPGEFEIENISPQCNENINFPGNLADVSERSNISSDPTTKQLDEAINQTVEESNENVILPCTESNDLVDRDSIKDNEPSQNSVVNVIEDVLPVFSDSVVSEVSMSDKILVESRTVIDQSIQNTNITSSEHIDNEYIQSIKNVIGSLDACPTFDSHSVNMQDDIETIPVDINIELCENLIDMKPDILLKPLDIGESYDQCVDDILPEDINSITENMITVHERLDDHSSTEKGTPDPSQSLMDVTPYNLVAKELELSKGSTQCVDNQSDHRNEELKQSLADIKPNNLLVQELVGEDDSMQSVVNSSFERSAEHSQTLVDIEPGDLSSKELEIGVHSAQCDDDNTLPVDSSTRSEITHSKQFFNVQVTESTDEVIDEDMQNTYENDISPYEESNEIRSVEELSCERSYHEIGADVPEDHLCSDMMISEVAINDEPVHEIDAVQCSTSNKLGEKNLDSLGDPTVNVKHDLDALILHSSSASDFVEVQENTVALADDETSTKTSKPLVHTELEKFLIEDLEAEGKSAQCIDDNVVDAEIITITEATSIIMQEKINTLPSDKIHVELNESSVAIPPDSRTMEDLEFGSDSVQYIDPNTSCIDPSSVSAVASSNIIMNDLEVEDFSRTLKQNIHESNEDEVSSPTESNVHIDDVEKCSDNRSIQKAERNVFDECSLTCSNVIISEMALNDKSLGESGELYYTSQNEDNLNNSEPFVPDPSKTMNANLGVPEVHTTSDIESHLVFEECDDNDIEFHANDTNANTSQIKIDPEVDKPLAEALECVDNTVQCFGKSISSEISTTSQAFTAIPDKKVALPLNIVIADGSKADAETELNTVLSEKLDIGKNLTKNIEDDILVDSTDMPNTHDLNTIASEVNARSLSEVVHLTARKVTSEISISTDSNDARGFTKDIEHEQNLEAGVSFKDDHSDVCDDPTVSKTDIDDRTPDTHKEMHNLCDNSFVTNDTIHKDFEQECLTDGNTDIDISTPNIGINDNKDILLRIDHQNIPENLPILDKVVFSSTATSSTQSQKEIPCDTSNSVDNNTSVVAMNYDDPDTSMDLVLNSTQQCDSTPDSTVTLENILDHKICKSANDTIPSVHVYKLDGSDANAQSLANVDAVENPDIQSVTCESDKSNIMNFGVISHSQSLTTPKPVNSNDNNTLTRKPVDHDSSKTQVHRIPFVFNRSINSDHSLLESLESLAKNRSLKMTITKQSDNLHSVIKARDASGISVNASSRKLIIKPATIKSTQAMSSISKSPMPQFGPRITIKSVIKSNVPPQQSISPLKITIKTSKTEIPSDTKVIHSPRLCAKPLIRMPTESDSPRVNMKQSFKQLDNPDVIEVEENVSDLDRERIVLKINRKREIDASSEKTPKIKVKIPRRGGHPHIIPEYASLTTKGVSNQKLSTFHESNVAYPAPHSTASDNIIASLLSNDSISFNRTIESSDYRELLDIDSEKSNIPFSRKNASSSPSSVIDLLSEDSNQSCILVDADTQPVHNSVGRVMQVEEIKELQAFQKNIEQVGASLSVQKSALVPTDNILQTPRKRGRPRKVPLVAREEFTNIPHISKEITVTRIESSRPKRTCAQSVHTTLGIKPRKPRGPGRGRGGNRCVGDRTIGLPPDEPEIDCIGPGVELVPVSSNVLPLPVVPTRPNTSASVSILSVSSQQATLATEKRQKYASGNTKRGRPSRKSLELKRQLAKQQQQQVLLKSSQNSDIENDVVAVQSTSPPKATSTGLFQLEYMKNFLKLPTTTYQTLCESSEPNSNVSSTDHMDTTANVISSGLEEGDSFMKGVHSMSTSTTSSHSTSLKRNRMSTEIAIFEEETRMSADTSMSTSRAPTPAKQLLVGENEESQSSVQSSATTESTKEASCSNSGSRTKKAKRIDLQETKRTIVAPGQLAEYYWGGNGPFMLQEQVAQFLGIKSFKRKYPNLPRRVVDMQERDYLRDSGLADESMCDLGLIAVNAADILDIMYTDFQEKYEEYCKHQRDQQAKELANKQKILALLAASQEKNKLEIMRQAVQSAAQWNSNLNSARNRQRRSCIDLQTYNVHYPKGRIKVSSKMPLGNYPVALVPGQFVDYYKEYTPEELGNLPMNTISDIPITRFSQYVEEEMEVDSHSDGSGSDSDSSSSGSECSYSDSSDDCALCKSRIKTGTVIPAT